MKNIIKERIKELQTLLKSTTNPTTIKDLDSQLIKNKELLNGECFITRDNHSLLAIDFEYKGTKNAIYELVASAVSDGTNAKAGWLYYSDTNKKAFKDFLQKRRNTHVMLCFNAEAEAKSFIALGLNPLNFKWIDIQAEWKMITNHYDDYRYGEHLIDGKKVTTKRKAYHEEEVDPNPRYTKAPHNLLSCTYKMLRNVGPKDYDYKNNMIRIILNNDTYTEEQREEILKYCKGDIADLFDIHKKITDFFMRTLDSKHRSTFFADQLWRGESVVRTAIMSTLGYPVNRRKLVKFTQNIPRMINDIHEDINSQFPEMEVFRYTSKKNEFMSLNTKVVKDWIIDSKYKVDWPMTDTGDYSLSLDAFSKFFSWRHDFPRDNFPAQFLRFLKFKQSINGFQPKSVTAKNKKTFFSTYGSDDRSHAYLNAYGSQSGRYQPSSTGFLHLKAAWMRSLCEPVKGKSIASIDYGSEEFLIGALLSNDEKMIEAYASGDVYLYFAKLAGAVPWEGTKKEYADVRQVFKSTVLGISYQMAAESLSRKLTEDTGKHHTKEEAENLIKDFKKAFPVYVTWREDTELKYYDSPCSYLRLADGFVMGPDNNNRRSVSNMPVQGHGSVVLRKAIQLARSRRNRSSSVLYEGSFRF
jgi:hypothetical protein